MRSVTLAGLIPLALLTASCVLGPEPRFARHVAEGTYCAAKEALDLPPSHRVADEAGATAHAAEERGYSPRSLDIARAIGALAQVERTVGSTTRAASTTARTC